MAEASLSCLARCAPATPALALAVPLIRASREGDLSSHSLCVACVRRLRGSIRAEAWAAARRQIPKSIMADQPDEPESQQGRHGAQVLRVLTLSLIHI